MATLPAPFHVFLPEDIVTILTFWPVDWLRVRSCEGVKQLRSARMIAIAQSDHKMPGNDDGLAHRQIGGPKAVLVLLTCAS